VRSEAELAMARAPWWLHWGYGRKAGYRGAWSDPDPWLWSYAHRSAFYQREAA